MSPLASTAFSSALWFLAILAIIPLALWLLKRSPAGARLTGGAPGGLRHIAALPLSTSQRIVTVEVGEGESRRWLVLGVTPQQISTLCTLEPPQTPPADTSPTPPGPQTLPGFAQILDRLRGDGRGRP